jgi:protein-S-isoprenylcysteine O-methyltransferase Ste14
MDEFRRALPRSRGWMAYAAFLPAWVLIAVVDSVPVAFAWFLAGRAAYVLFVGFSLRAQNGNGWYTRRFGAEEGYRRFRCASLALMLNDVAGIVLVGWAGRGTVTAPFPDWQLVALGGVLCAAGMGIRAWATASLPEGSFFWKGAFIPFTGKPFVTSGPYRWFANPMYTLGYLHAYGAALMFRSLPGLAAAFIAQAAILWMNGWAERPHTERLRVTSSARGAPARRAA